MTHEPFLSRFQRKPALRPKNWQRLGLGTCVFDDSPSTSWTLLLAAHAAEISAARCQATEVRSRFECTAPGSFVCGKGISLGACGELVARVISVQQHVATFRWPPLATLSSGDGRRTTPFAPTRDCSLRQTKNMLVSPHRGLHQERFGHSSWMTR